MSKARGSRTDHGFVSREHAPPAWRRGSVEACGVRLFYLTCGSERPDAPTVLLLHGLGHWSNAAWDRLVPHLGPGRRIVAVDLPGFGDSAKPRAAYDLPFFRSILSAFADRMLPQRFALIGHSLGGALAADYAAHAPERVAALVLVAPAGFAHTRRARFYAFAARVARPLFALPAPRFAIAAMLRLSVVDARVLGAGDLAHSLRLARDPAVRAAVAGVYAADTTGFSASAARYRGPVLCAWGRHDRFLPAASIDAVRETYPHAQTALFEHSAHLPMVEEAAALGARVRAFLAAADGFAHAHGEGAAIERTAAPLAARVAQLGSLVGDVLRSHAREGTFERVEALRSLTRERRRSATNDEIDALIEDVLGSLDVEDAIDVIRAFNLYFQYVNLAEQLQRERRRRERALLAQAPLRGSLETLPDDAAERLTRIEIGIVFTAHPTEVLRRTTSEKLAIVAGLLRTLDERVATSEDAAAIEAELRAQTVLLWQSNELYATAPTVDDEVRNLVARFRESLFDEVPLLFERLEARFGDRIPTFLSFGSWIGADRDGNANVAPDAVAAAHEQARRFVLGRYLEAVEALQARYSQDAVRGTVPDAIVADVEHDVTQLADVRYAIGPRQQAEPYRRKLAFVHRRLSLTLADAEGGYADADALRAELAPLEQAVGAYSGHEAALPLRRLLRAIDLFGFRLCALEWRQHRDRVVAALDEVVAIIEPGAPALSARAGAERAAWFARELISARPLLPRGVAFSPATADVLASLQAVTALRNRRGAGSVRSFILAGTESADDLFALLVLVRACGALHAGPAQVVPLFESTSALQNAEAIAAAALAVPAFRTHVGACGDVWELMLGYSDSTKVAGIVSSTWAIYRAQEALAKTLHAAHVAPRFFHGRGGSVGRGAADAGEAVASQPPAAHNGRFKVTEQGEVIGARYGLSSLARRNLELAVTAVCGELAAEERPLDAADEALIDRFAAAARSSYVALIEAPGFLDFFAACTPVDEIGAMQISSRPGRRGARTTIDDLRAIPWSFGWTQARALLPGWYGISAALAANRADLPALQRLARGAPFFATMLRSIERALAVADLDIFERYANTLVTDEAARTRFVPAIRQAYEDSVAAVKELRGIDHLLAEDATLERSIALRNPYVDPISLLQVRLLKAYRENPTQQLGDAIRTTINGIAAGLRVTG